MVKQYVNLHGVIHPNNGFIVPKNIDKNIKICLAGVPGYITSVQHGNMAKHNISWDSSCTIEFNSFDYMFDLDITNVTTGGEYDVSTTYISTQPENYTRYNVLDIYTDGTKKNHHLNKIRDSGYFLSQLVYETCMLYQGKELEIYVYSCMGLPSFGDLLSLNDEFKKRLNIHKNPEEESKVLCLSYTTYTGYIKDLIGEGCGIEGRIMINGVYHNIDGNDYISQFQINRGVIGTENFEKLKGLLESRGSIFGKYTLWSDRDIITAEYDKNLNTLEEIKKYALKVRGNECKIIPHFKMKNGRYRSIRLPSVEHITLEEILLKLRGKECKYSEVNKLLEGGRVCTIDVAVIPYLTIQTLLNER